MTSIDGIAGVGALLGMALSAGALLVGYRVRAIMRPSLSTRTLAYLGIDPSTDRGLDPLQFLFTLIPARRRVQGAPPWVTHQLLWIAGGIACGAVIGVGATLRGNSPVLLILIPGLGGMVGVLAERQFRSTRDKRLRARVAQQLPSVAELLAFAVAAGESIVPALARVSDETGGELSDALRECVADIRSGETLEVALRRVAVTTGSPDVERFVDRITISLERGTPLAEVLRAQAADARAHQRNSLIETAGRKDVAMLIPVVFLILPTVVLIALFPGFRALTLVSG